MRAYIYNIVAVALLFASCVKGGDSAGIYVAEAGFGKVAFNVATESSVATRSDKFELPAEYIPTAEEIELRIVGSYLDVDDDMQLKEYDQTFESVATYNELLPYLPAGDYTASVYHDNSAIFAGSVSFTVVARRLDAEANLTATLQNSAIKVTATDSFVGYFGGGATITISTSAGDKFQYIYPMEGEPAIIFVDADLELYLEGEGTKQATTESGRAESVTFTKQKIGTTAMATISNITIDAAAAGGATITVTLEDTITEYTESDLELNPLS